MNKHDLIDAISSKTSISKKESHVVLSAMMDTIMDAVSTGEKVTLVGFGTFAARRREAREARLPGMRQPLHIPATTVPAFSAGKVFRDKVQFLAVRQELGRLMNILSLDA